VAERSSVMGQWVPQPCVACNRPIQATSEAHRAPWWLPDCRRWACWRCHAKYSHRQLVQMGLGGVMQSEMMEGVENG
jgi:hypothetical protein